MWIDPAMLVCLVDDSSVCRWVRSMGVDMGVGG